MWSFFLSPITFVLELIGFLISAAFVYSLAFIAAMTLIAYGISTYPNTEYVYITEVVQSVAPVVENVVETIKEVPGLVCERIDGCRVMWDKYGIEYCPTCLNK